MQLTENTIYHHDDLGDVLVCGIHHVFETYDTDTADGRLRSSVVRFAVEWDEYGPMPASVRTTPVDAFRATVGDAVRTWDGTAWTDDDA